MKPIKKRGNHKLLYTEKIPIERSQHIQTEPVTDEDTSPQIEKPLLLVKWFFTPLFYATMLFQKLNEYQFSYRKFPIVSIFRVDTNPHSADVNQTMRATTTTKIDGHLEHLEKSSSSKASPPNQSRSSRRKKPKRKFFNRPGDVVVPAESCKRTYIAIEKDEDGPFNKKEG